MLKLIEKSSNKKTGPIAVTYRAGSHNVFSTCPSACPLNPQGPAGARLIDKGYLKALLEAVPPGGMAWTYSHFGPEAVPRPESGKTVINLSMHEPEAAAAAAEQGHAVTLTVGLGQAWPRRVGKTAFVQCPAEKTDTKCIDCGNGRPLCARPPGPDRNFVVVFTAHGPSKKLVGEEQQGGCYGTSGPVRLAWENTKQAPAGDAVRLKAWAQALPPGSLIRHHIVGDLGRAQA